MGRRSDPPAPEFTDAERKLLQTSAAIDQVLSLCDTAMRVNAGNRELVDLALDISNTLRRL